MDEPRCPHCGIQTPGSKFKNNPLTRGWGSDEQWVRAIIFVNAALFIFSLVVSKGDRAGGFNIFGMLSPSGTAYYILGATGTRLVEDVGWWTLISANYLHGGVLHILFNMMAFSQIAPLITRLFGTYRFFAIYTISGVGGFLISHISGIPITAGASAALCGLIGAALYYGKSRGGLFGQAIYKQIGGWALGLLIFGFLIPQINNAAHIGGMVFGGLCAYFLGYHEIRRESTPHRIFAGGCIMVTVVVLSWSILRGLLYLLGR
jgi:rhomboid protease GluP